MTTLDKIKADIEQIKPYDYPCDKRTPEHIKDMALKIIDKYAEQSGWEEMTVPCKHCGKDMTFKIATVGEPCEDCKYKSMAEQEPIPEQWQELKETILEMRDNDGTGTQQEVCKFLVNYMGVLEKQMVEQEPCDDVVSRQAVLDRREILRDEQGTGHQAVKTKYIRELPSVQPKPKTGHWIQTNEFFVNQDGQFNYKFICSECKSLSYFRKSNKKAIGAICPNCGARMSDESV